MNPIPDGGALTTVSFSAPSYLDLVMLLTVVSLLVIFGLMLWNGRRQSRALVRLFCPVRLRRVRIVLGLSPGGMAADVLRCSEFRSRAITCGKACLHTTVR